MLKKIIIFIILLVVLIFAIRFLVNEQKYFKACEYHEGDVAKWEAMLPHKFAYEMGLNDDEEPVFKDPDMAVIIFKEDYSKVIDVIRKENKIGQFSKYNCKEYNLYASKLETDDQVVEKQAADLITFTEILQHSYLQYKTK